MGALLRPFFVAKKARRTLNARLKLTNLTMNY